MLQVFKCGLKVLNNVSAHFIILEKRIDGVVSSANIRGETPLDVGTAAGLIVKASDMPSVRNPPACGRSTDAKGSATTLEGPAA